MYRIENPKVIASIIECLSLPINKKCESVLVDRCEMIFCFDEYDNYYCRFPVWSNFCIKWWGPEFTVMKPHDIGNWEIDCKTGKYRRICYYTREGKIKYGRYYEPSMD